MEFIKNLTKPFESASDFLRERLATRLASAYAISWLVYNWRLVYYFITSDADTETKINIIDIKYIDHPYMYVFPLFFAFGYIILYPPLSALADFFWTLLDNLPRRRFKAFLEGQVPLYEDDRVALFSYVHAQSEKANEEINRKNKEIASLRALLANSGVLNSEIENAEEITDNDEDVYDYDSIINSGALNSENTIYFLRRWLSSKFFLSVEDPVHQLDLDRIVLVIQSIARSHPEPWKIKELTLSTKDGRKKIITIEVVKSIIIRLVGIGMIIPPYHGLKGLNDLGSKEGEFDDLFVLTKEGVKQIQEFIATT